MRLLLLMLLLPALASAAAAGPSLCEEAAGTTCVGYTEFGSDDCREDGSYRFEGQQILVEMEGARAWVFAHEVCTNYGDYEANGHGVHAEATHSGTGAGVQWVEVSGTAGDGCGINPMTISPDGYRYFLLPCPVGPPNPGWGQLLP